MIVFTRTKSLEWAERLYHEGLVHVHLNLEIEYCVRIICVRVSTKNVMT
jgi:hypothetical protein